MKYGPDKNDVTITTILKKNFEEHKLDINVDTGSGILTPANKPDLLSICCQFVGKERTCCQSTSNNITTDDYKSYVKHYVKQYRPSNFLVYI